MGCWPFDVDISFSNLFFQLAYGAESEPAVGSPHHLCVHLQRIRQDSFGQILREQGEYRKTVFF